MIVIDCYTNFVLMLRIRFSKDETTQVSWMRLKMEMRLKHAMSPRGFHFLCMPRIKPLLLLFPFLPVQAVTRKYFPGVSEYRLLVNFIK